MELLASLYAAVVATKVGTVVAGSRLHYNISAVSKIGSVYLGSFSNDENENHYKSITVSPCHPHTLTGILWALLELVHL